MHDRALVKAILENHDAFEWTLQGFGMLRTYIAPELRLHVWDSRFRNEGVSELHTHPWNFHSTVVSGRVHNIRFVDLGEDPDPKTGVQWNRQTILCGPGGGLVDDGQAVVYLAQSDTETYEVGQEYTQTAHEVHLSRPDDGTVTLVSREFLDDTEHAYVYWPLGEEWITAEPRPATPEEIDSIITNALEKWSP